MSEETERTEPATAKKRQEFRDRGEVARSQDLTASLGLLAGVAAMGALGDGIAEALRSGLTTWLSALGEVHQRPFTEAVSAPLLSVGLAVAPLLLVAAAAGIGAHFLQTGFYIPSEALKFDLNRLNPLPRLTGLVSMAGLGNTLKGFVKLIVVGAVVYRVVAGDLERLSSLVDASVGESAAMIASLCLRALGYGGFCILLIGLADYGYQRYAMEKRMRMSKDEVKQEFKQQEGDPLVKGRIRGKQRQLARQRMMEAVKTADVVVTNPTHIAVALSYRPGEMGAPRVVAKGQGAIAERIKATARAAGVPVMENKPLARALNKSVKVGREVPAALYRAVAEVLAFVYGRKRGRGYSAQVLTPSPIGRS